MGLGRLEGLLLRKAGWLTVSRGLVLAGVAGLSGDWCRKHACRASASCLCGKWGVVGAPLRAWCVWGWHAVGVLGQCALGCPARPGFHFLGFWVGVGGLVVNCIVDASILL